MASADTGTKLSIIRIVQVLMKHSSKEHPLSQKDIEDLLETDYGMTVNRKSIRRNLERLKDAGFPVVCRDVPRTIRGKSSPLSLDWYWEHSFSLEEMKRLSDIIYMSHASYREVLQLTRKIKEFSNLPFEDGKENVRNLPEYHSFDHVYKVLAPISEAITNKKKITFYHDHLGVDGKMYHDEGKDGKEKLYKASPYVVVTSDTRYGLLFNEDGREDIHYFSLDLMSHVQVLDENARLQTKLNDQEGSVRPEDYLWSFRKIIFGESQICTFEASRKLMTAITLDFGERAHIIKATEDKVMVSVEVAPDVLFHWALFFGSLVTITSPSSLVKKMKDQIEDLVHVYGRRV